MEIRNLAAHLFQSPILGFMDGPSAGCNSDLTLAEEDKHNLEVIVSHILFTVILLFERRSLWLQAS